MRERRLESWALERRLGVEPVGEAVVRLGTCSKSALVSVSSVGVSVFVVVGRRSIRLWEMVVSMGELIKSAEGLP